MGRWAEYEGYVIALAIPVIWATLLGGVGGDVSYWLRFWWVFPIALTLTLLADTVSISRGALLLPALLLVAPLSGESISTVQAVRIVTIVGLIGYTGSALAFARHGTVDLRLAASAAVVAGPAAFGGGVLLPAIASPALLVVAAAILVLTAYSLLSPTRRRTKRSALLRDSIDQSHPAHTHNTMLRARDERTYRYCRCGWRVRLPGLVFGGLADGIAGLGMPGLAVGAFTRSEIPLPVTIGTLHASAAASAALAVVAHANPTTGTLPWNLLAVTVTAVLIGGQLAPYLGGQIMSEYPERLTAATLVLAAAALLVRLA